MATQPLDQTSQVNNTGDPNQPSQNFPAPVPVSTPSGTQTNTPSGTPTGTVPAPAPINRSLFDHVLSSLDPAPKYVFDEQGNKVAVPTSRKSMTAHILAGALTSIIKGAQAGAAASANAPAGPAGTMGPANRAAMAAGAQAGTDVRTQIQNAPQAQIDAQTVAKFNAASNNVKMLQQMVASSRLNHEYLGSMVTNNQDILKSMKDSDARATDPSDRVTVASGLTWDQAQKQFHSVNQNMIVDGVTDYVAADGTVHEQPTYTIINPNSTVHLSREAIDTLSRFGIPGFQDLQERTTGSIPLRASTVNRYAIQANNLTQVEGWLKKTADEIGVPPVDLVAAVKQDKTLLPAVDDAEAAIMQGYSTAGALNKLRETPAGGKLINLLGADDVEQYIQDKQNEHLKAASESKGAAQIEIAKLRTQNKPLSDTVAASILSDPNAAPVDRARAQSFQTIRNTQKQIQERASTAIKQGDPAVAAQLLYSGVLTLSQLKARSATPAFITQVTDAALGLAKQSGQPDWTPQTAENQFKTASGNQNVQFFGSANSLLDPTGTLAQLQSQHAKLENGQLPLFNKWGDYLAYQAGDPALAGFLQTAIGVADDYAKVMGGGVGTDASRLAVMQSFANAHNPAQMQAAITAAHNAVASQVSARIGQNKIMQQMYGQNVPENAQRQPQATQTAPVQVPPVSLLKEGVRTTFKNGQTWMLQNGKPVQVRQ